MARIYGSFTDAALAEKAAGALLDYGVNSDDLSLIRSGNEDDFRNWQASRAESTYGVAASPGMDYDENIAGSPSGQTIGNENTASGLFAPEANRPDAMTNPDESRIHGQFIDRSDPQYIYENKASNAEMNDPHYQAVQRASNSDYVENREEMDRENPEKLDSAAKHGISTTTPADAGAGAAKGAGIGLGVGIIAGLASLFVPGLGFLVGGGALATAVAGALGTAGAGAIAGGVTGYLKDQGVDEHVVTDYHNTLTSGGALIEVNLPSGDVDEATAREVLNKYGASNVGAYAGSNQGYVS